MRRGVIVLIVAAVVVGTVYAFLPHGSTPTTTTTTSTSTTSTTSTTLPQTPKERALQAHANAIAVRAGCPESPQTPVNTDLHFTKPPPQVIDASATYSAVFRTDAGSFTVTIDPKNAPISANNFVFLVHKGYYRCNAFFRVIPDFVNQSGNPVQTNVPQLGYSLPNEPPPPAKDPKHQYPLGALAMANGTVPNSTGSQFFIVNGPSGEALPNSYALVGTVTSGMDVVDAIARQGRPSGSPKVVHRILSITVTRS